MASPRVAIVGRPEEIEDVDLAGTRVTDVGLKRVGKLRGLTWLDLSDTRVTDDGLKELADLTKLAHLYLQNTRVTDAGVAPLRKALPNCKIEDSPPGGQ
jgi:internalin A